MKTLVVLAALAATAHAAPPPKLFAKLLAQGAKWTFPAQFETSNGDSGTQKTHLAPGKVTCRIAKAHDIKGGWSAELACTGMALADHLDGTYVATADGLWKRSGDDKLTPDTMLIAAKPVAGDREKRSHDVIDIIESYQVDQRDAAWCFGYERSAGDGDGYTLCFTEKQGLVGGSASFSGGTDRDLYFGVLTR